MHLYLSGRGGGAVLWRAVGGDGGGVEEREEGEEGWHFVVEGGRGRGRGREREEEGGGEGKGKGKGGGGREI